jgi:alanine dehydrogenase
LILFSFLSLQVDRGLMQALLVSRFAAFTMATISDWRGGACRSSRRGARSPGTTRPRSGRITWHHLQRSSGEWGILLGGLAGVRSRRFVILGCGIVGSAAAKVSNSLGARVLS